MMYKRANTSQKSVFLTFDDGPHARHTARILNILKKYKIKATFFLVGKQVKKYPYLASRIVQEGHDVGNHTYTHPMSPIMNCRAMAKEIQLAGKVIEKVTKVKPFLFRPTWSEWDRYNESMVQMAEDLGYRSVRWSTSSLDWLGWKPLIHSRVVKKEHCANDILLLHDGAEKSMIKSRKATAAVIEKLFQRKHRRTQYRKLSDYFD